MKEYENTDTKEGKFDRIAKEYITYLTEQGQQFIYHDGRFYIYRGTHYQEQSERELNQNLRTFLRHKGQPQSNNVIGNVVPIVQNFGHKPLSEYGSLPFWQMTATADKPKPKDIIAYQNGLLDVSKPQADLLPHSPKWVSSTCLPFRYDRSATCPQWLAFLSETFDEADSVKTLQEWFGYCLTADTSQQTALIKVGPPRAGKGLTDRVLTALVGEENSTGFNLNYLADKFGPRRLVGKQLATIDEVNLSHSKDKPRILETLNSIIGEDRIAIEEKYNNDSPSVVLPVRFSISCNEMPTFVDPSGALTARLLVLNYDKSHAGDEDRELEARLLAELSGVNNWALAGLARLREQKRFTRPQRMQETLRKFRRDGAQAFAFMQDCLIVEARLNPGNLDGVRLSDEQLTCTSKQLLTAYGDWCIDNSKTNQGSWIVRNLQTLLPRMKVVSKSVERGHEKSYEGVGIAIQ